MKTKEPTKQKDIVAYNNNYKVSKNKHTTDEDKNKQIHSLIKIHLKKITKLKNTKNWSTKYQKINTQPIKSKKVKYIGTLRYAWITLIKMTNAKNWT